MSRKLIFAAGLLHCFFCQLDEAAAQARDALKGPMKDVAALTEYMERQLVRTPLELVAKACLDLNVAGQTSRSIFDNYDRFLAILDDSQRRADLEKVSANEDLRSSEVWKEVREVSRSFHNSLVALFLHDDDSLKQLTMKYGVF